MKKALHDQSFGIISNMQKIIFMGTSEFGILSFHTLCENFDVVAVFTKPEKPRGRGQKITKSKVHIAAEEKGILVHTCANLSESYNTIKTINPDFIVVCDYGIIIPDNILSLPKYYTLNIHPSNLPRWRGATPIQSALMFGDAKTAVCIMEVVKDLDAGPIFKKQIVKIEKDDDYGSLYEKLSKISSQMIVNVIKEISESDLKPKPQEQDGVTYAKKIEKQDQKIDFKKDAYEIFNKIRALSPKPGAFTDNFKLRFKILKADPIKIEHKMQPGMFINDDKLCCQDDTAIVLQIVQPEGKNKMTQKDFINGYIRRGIIK